MAGRRRRRRVEPTDDWYQLQLLCGWPEQVVYEEIRPLVLFGSSAAATPDPVVGGGANTGRVWLTNQWVRAQGEPNKLPAKWGTWNWAAKP